MVWCRHLVPAGPKKCSSPRIMMNSVAPIWRLGWRGRVRPRSLPARVRDHLPAVYFPILIMWMAPIFAASRSSCASRLRPNPSIAGMRLSTMHSGRHAGTGLRAWRIRAGASGSMVASSQADRSTGRTPFSVLTAISLVLGYASPSGATWLIMKTKASQDWARTQARWLMVSLSASAS